MNSRVRMSICLVVGMTVLLVFAATSYAGARDHEDGFFLRLALGAGPASTENTGLTMDGTGVDFDAAIGGMVSPNLALHGSIFGWQVSDPEVSYGSASTTLDAGISVAAVGAGVTYYLMPTNAYVSASVGYGKLTLEIDNVSAETDGGLVFGACVGKEWWVGDEWGLGVAGGLTYHSIPEDGMDDNWTGTSFALRFTATKN